MKVKVRQFGMLCAVFVSVVLVSNVYATNVVGNGNLWVSINNHGTYELREYSVTSSSATLLHTYSAPTVFTDMQYTESLGSPQLVAVDGATHTLYLIDTSTGVITQQGIQEDSDHYPNAVAVTYTGKVGILSKNWGPYKVEYKFEKLSWNNTGNRWGRTEINVNWGVYYGMVDNAYLSDIDPFPASESKFYFAQSRDYPGEANNNYGLLDNVDWDNCSGNETAFYTTYSGNGGGAFRDLDVSPESEMFSGLAQNLKKAGIFDEDGNLLKSYYYSYPSGYRIEGGVRTIASNEDGSLMLLSPQSQYPEGWQTAAVDEIIVIDTATMGTDSGALYKIDLDPNARGEIRPSAIAMAWEAVPEPASMMLLLLGLMGVISRRIY